MRHRRVVAVARGLRHKPLEDRPLRQAGCGREHGRLALAQSAPNLLSVDRERGAEHLPHAGERSVELAHLARLHQRRERARALKVACVQAAPPTRLVKTALCASRAGRRLDDARECAVRCAQVGEGGVVGGTLGNLELDADRHPLDRREAELLCDRRVRLGAAQQVRREEGPHAKQRRLVGPTLERMVDERVEGGRLGEGARVEEGEEALNLRQPRVDWGPRHHPRLPPPERGRHHRRGRRAVAHHLGLV
mmetsp:Transcript_6460/g.21595  ORF Transcript_6460/g.21595 Transcript_6460/m.21595 type:complete len:250 (+) Transcript_6460:1479-2228(+)